jgi:hypothetical protein
MDCKCTIACIFTALDVATELNEPSIERRIGEEELEEDMLAATPQIGTTKHRILDLL